MPSVVKIPAVITYHRLSGAWFNSEGTVVLRGFQAARGNFQKMFDSPQFAIPGSLEDVSASEPTPVVLKVGFWIAFKNVSAWRLAVTTAKGCM